MVQTLIVPLDGSVESVRALPFARSAVRTFGGQLVLLRAVQHVGPDLSTTNDEPVWLELEALARELRKEGIAAEAQVHWAQPSTAIVEAVRAYHARMIVMAGHQRHGFAAWLRGGTTQEVLHQTPVPVVVVPADGAPVPAAGSTLRVLVPLDGSALAESALVQLRALTESRPLEVWLVNVVQLRYGPFGTLLPYLPDPEAERRESARYLHDLSTSLGADGLVAHTNVIWGQDSVGRELLDFAQRVGIDLIAMATHGRSAFAHLALGSVSTEVLEHSLIPVLLVPRQAASESIGDSAGIERQGVDEALPRYAPRFRRGLMVPRL